MLEYAKLIAIVTRPAKEDIAYSALIEFDFLLLLYTSTLKSVAM